jgi:flavorubredoxin
MANAVAEGARSLNDINVEISYHIEPEELEEFDAIVLGAPTYHHDMPIDMKKLFEKAAIKELNLKDKIGAAFGSFGWSGEAPRLLLEIMKNKFEMNIIAPPLLVKYAPNQNTLSKCRDFGKTISENLIH